MSEHIWKVFEAARRKHDVEELGTLVSAGNIACGDPCSCPDRINIAVPAGKHHVMLLRKGDDIAAGLLLVGNTAPVTWRDEGVIPVDAALASFMDSEHARELLTLFDDPDAFKVSFYDDVVDDALYGGGHPKDYATVEFKKGKRVHLFSTGSDGEYAVRTGLDAKGAPCVVVIDLANGP